MPQIKDLIELPLVETVIQLRTVSDMYHQNQELSAEQQAYILNLARSFVLTDDIETNLNVILEAIRQREGRGFFLSGSFGSGKSHFLSVLSLLLQPLTFSDQLWSPLRQQQPKLRVYEQAIQHRKLLIVDVSLVEHKASLSLEEIVFDAIQSRLSAPPYNIDILLAESAYFLAQFKTYVLPIHEKRLDKWVHQKYPDCNTWLRLLDKHPAAAYELTRNYLDSLADKIPIQLTLDREKGFSLLEETLETHEIDGVVILIDELSEFLKSKSNKQALNEDARFLQFLGEWSARKPLWIVAALQEHIEKTGEIQKTVINKIKDRYHTRLNLSTQHIRELIDNRLIVKKAGSRPPIEAAYRQLKSSFNAIPLQLDDFIEIYPVHPETLEVLSVCADLFSQRRGVVDFIHYQVGGDSSRQIEGILEADFTHLLTPDRIFDHFEDRFRESPQLRPYYDVFHDYFMRRLPRLFDKAEDVIYAQRFIKILILLKIASVHSQRTVHELANMILTPIFTDLPGAVNYQYIAEHLFQKMVHELNYFRVTPGRRPQDMVVELDLGATTIDTLAEKVRAMQQKTNPTQMMRTFMHTMTYGVLPLAHYLQHPTGVTTMWMNTERSGQVWVRPLQTLAHKDLRQLIEQLKTTENDFMLLIAPPGNSPSEMTHISELFRQFETRFIHGLIAWVPAEFEHPDLLKKWYAYHQIARQYKDSTNQEEKELHQMAANKCEAVDETLRQALLTVYRRGKFICGPSQFAFDYAVSAYQNFEELLGLIIHQPLQKLFPKHDHIEINMPFGSNQMVNDLISKFIIPGEVENVDAAHNNLLRQSLNGVAEPLQLVKFNRKGKHARLTVDPKKSPACEIVIEAVKHHVRDE